VERGVQAVHAVGRVAARREEAGGDAAVAEAEAVEANGQPAGRIGDGGFGGGCGIGEEGEQVPRRVGALRQGDGGAGEGDVGQVQFALEEGEQVVAGGGRIDPREFGAVVPDERDVGQREAREERAADGAGP
jgi:hypothetical protein